MSGITNISKQPISSPIPQTYPSSPPNTPRIVKPVLANRDYGASPTSLKIKNFRELTPSSPLLKPLEIIICTITIIGLLVLLGLYLGRKFGQASVTNTLKPILPVGYKDYDTALKQQKENILQVFPQLRNIVKNWDISLEDQVLLLQLMELGSLGVSLPLLDQIGSYFEKDSSEFIYPFVKVKNLIALDLSEVISLDVTGTNSRCPDSIGLLVNLEELYIADNEKMTAPPNLRNNIKLKRLDIENNKFTTPPDLSQNVNLEILQFWENPLSAPPDVSHNLKLTTLALAKTNLERLPDVRQNKKLETLVLSDNKLTSSPDISSNENLKELLISKNCLKEAPDVSHNPKLIRLEASDNLLTVPPDIRNNEKLEQLDLLDNQFSDQAKIDYKLWCATHRPNLNVLLY